MIERVHLNILREIEREGSLTAAANRLHLTQPALTHTIKKLESMSGTILWKKQGRNLQFTQAGRYLLREAKRLLPQLERADEVLAEYAQGNQGTLHIGMECHPCYQWLLKIVEPFLAQWPSIDVDVKPQYQFGGMAALFNHDIDLLVTPDPVLRPGIEFTPVFPYEQVLVVSSNNTLAELKSIEADQMNDQILYTYPVSPERLDIYRQFLLPAHCAPRSHKTVEATEILMQMVAANRGVTTLPDWLAAEYRKSLPIKTIRLGKTGINKQIHLGSRSGDEIYPYLQAFVDLAKESANSRP